MLSDIAVFYSDLENSEQAIDYIEKALSMNQEDIDILVNAVSTYENLGMRQEALEWVRADITSRIEWLPDLQLLKNDSDYIELKEKLLKQES